MSPSEPIAEPPPPDWAAKVGAPLDELNDPASALAPGHPALPARVGSDPARTPTAGLPGIPDNLPATMPDREFDAPGEVVVRHLVYRMRFIVPATLRNGRPPLAAPAGELHVDVALDRLRARFLGPGWPFDEGSEVRLRAGLPGVYLFDGQGGRPLLPGQLAAWFQGIENGRAVSTVRVQRDRGNGEGPGDLLCALLAEWTRQDRDELLPRCAGSLSPGFHFGLWSAELTAIVALKLPRSKLRADAGDPPPPIAAFSGRTLLDPAELARLLPVKALAPVRPQPTAADAGAPIEPQPTAAEPGAGLEVENHTDARVIVVVQGVAVGWLRAHTRLSIVGFSPGFYRVGAVRPFGQAAIQSTWQQIPGVLRVGRVTPSSLLAESPGP